MLRSVVLFVISILSATSSWSHTGSTSFLELEIHGAQVNGDWWLALRDLELAVGVDGNQDGHYLW